MNGFIKLGIALLVGILFGKLMNKFKIPAVAGYIVAGLLVGVSGLNIADSEFIDQISFISDFALGIIAFNIGSELKLSVIKKLGKSIFIIATCEALGAFFFVSFIVYVITKDPSTSLVLGAVASATAPAATVMVLKEYKAKGPLTSTLLGVVAVDDAICLMIYAVASAIAKVYIKHDVVTINKVLIHPLTEISLSLLTGAVIGIIISFVLKYCKNNEEILVITIGSILLLIGVSTMFDLSPLLTSMSAGILVTNVNKDSKAVFDNIENFFPPVVAAFFVLAGSRLDIALLPQVGLLGLAYLVFRILGKVCGASIGAIIAKSPTSVRKYIGFGLFSQVGVAVGLAIIVSHEFSGTNLGNLVLTILLATTVITELVGPLFTKTAVLKAKEANI